jgi:hypothetical protein
MFSVQAAEDGFDSEVAPPVTDCSKKGSPEQHGSPGIGASLASAFNLHLLAP